MARTRSKSSTSKKTDTAPEPVKQQPMLVEYKLSPNRMVPPDGFPIRTGDPKKVSQTMTNLRHGIVYKLDPLHPDTARYEANGLIERV